MNTTPLNITPMAKAGRSFGTQGTVVHGLALQGADPLQVRNGFKALCGTSCGPRSAGWAFMPDFAVNCPLCLARHARLARKAASADARPETPATSP